MGVFIFQPESLFLEKLKSTNKSLTVVSAFFNISGVFKKGYAGKRRLEDYKKWVIPFKYLQNPLVLFTDNKEDEKYFKLLLKNASCRVIVVRIDRNDLWSFQIIPEIRKLYANKSYPWHYPNTVYPAYTSITHSKLTLLKSAILKEYFQTDYYCWLDIGYFRHISSERRKFWLEVPQDFDSSKIGVTRVFNVPLKKITARQIILRNLNWIGGGLFLGTSNVILQFEKQYKRAVFYYLYRGLMNVEQQILYSMYTKEERGKIGVDVELQLYVPKGTGDPWFYLGHSMRRPVPLVTNAIQSPSTQIC